jgi:ribosomal protein S18 acetylase RimI-like enzyme
VLRLLDPNDDAVAAEIVAVQRSAYRIEADLIGFDGIPPLHESVADVQSHQLEWLGSFEGARLAGLIGWTSADGVCDIDRLAVDPAFARRGHGRRLVSELLYHPVIVVSTGTANAPARRLYESLGFAAVGTRAIAEDITVTLYRRAR